MIKNVLKGYRHVNYGLMMGGGNQFDIYFVLDGEQLEMTGILQDGLMYVSCSYLEDTDWEKLGLPKPSVYRPIHIPNRIVDLKDIEDSEIYQYSPKTPLNSAQLSAFLNDFGVDDDGDYGDY